MKLDSVLSRLHGGENDLARHLLHIADRHGADHETYHLGRDMAAWSQDHVRAIAEAGKRHGLRLDPEPATEPSVTARLRQKGGELLGRRDAAGMLLLQDLRSLYLDASGVSLDWEMLAQAAMGVKDTDLVGLAARCHPYTLRQIRWANAKLKESTPQVLAALS